MRLYDEDPDTEVMLLERLEPQDLENFKDDLSAARILLALLIIATGVTYRQLNAAGLNRFEGTGVFYTPLAAQDRITPGDPVVIAGGGNSAGQAATWLADHGHPVTVVIRGEDLTSHVAAYR